METYTYLNRLIKKCENKLLLTKFKIFGTSNLYASRISQNKCEFLGTINQKYIQIIIPESMVKYHKYIGLLFLYNQLSKDVADKSTNCPICDENSKDVSQFQVDSSKVKNIAVNEASLTEKLDFSADDDKNLTSNQLQLLVRLC